MALLLIIIWLIVFPNLLQAKVMLLLLGGCAVLCLRDVLPFTRWYKKEIRTCASNNKNIELDILVYNVYQENDKYQDLIDKVNELSPDLVLLLETNSEWDKALLPLNEIYPYSVKAIQDNTYGMMLLSKLKPLEKDIEYLDKKDVPSVDTLLTIKDRKLRIIGLHPLPPIPTEAMTSRQKDAEFEAAAERINELSDEEVKIVAGDLNDVVWSKASNRFKKSTGLKDPRVGRGTFSTFPTYSPIRFPLDHILCSPELELIELKVLENLGSDHFPIYVRFNIP